ncbi:hypothetical protein [Acetivibrio straminisolvens]|uniref:Uncharacterized protein n=2 Tax=Acetivibrio straminisolvens TaxID=253314 RepID=W4VBJ2_9FIRM|nr:hypothetical protein [Acetivibrio straminisolvens]GAE90785.1 hypothetical protein JCM21531_4424 [Acetivibrio straminisolvens JCM 21531]
MNGGIDVKMKMYITKEDLAQLTDSQKKNLNDMWYPQKYDLAVANICTNAETEEYQQIEFVVGDIRVYHTRFILYDLMFLSNMNNDDISEQEEASTELEPEEDSDFDENYDNEYDLDEESDEDENFDCLFIRPTTFTKEECLPLLSIGQMIEILNKNKSKLYDFYLLADNGQFATEMGSKDYNLSGYGSDFESKELCDVLWECVKLVL